MSQSPQQIADEELVNDAPETFAPVDLLPPNRTPFEYALGMTSARILNVDTQAIRRERDPMQCAAAFLPFLAWERSVHHYTGTDQAADAASVASSFDDHLSYGAPAALEAEIALDTGQTIRVVEFFEENDLIWPEFVAESVVNPGDPVPDLAAVRASALVRKNVRDRLHSVRTRGRQPPACVQIGAAAHVSPNVQVLPAVIPPPLPNIEIGAATRVFPAAQILPLKG